MWVELAVVSGWSLAIMPCCVQVRCATVLLLLLCHLSQAEGPAPVALSVLRHSISSQSRNLYFEKVLPLGGYKL